MPIKSHIGSSLPSLLKRSVTSFFLCLNLVARFTRCVGPKWHTNCEFLNNPIFYCWKPGGYLLFHCPRQNISQFIGHVCHVQSKTCRHFCHLHCVNSRKLLTENPRSRKRDSALLWNARIVLFSPLHSLKVHDFLIHSYPQPILRRLSKGCTTQCRRPLRYCLVNHRTIRHRTLVSKTFNKLDLAGYRVEGRRVVSPIKFNQYVSRLLTQPYKLM